MPYLLTREFDEGTNSPFIARMFNGILEIRNLIDMSNDEIPINKQISKEFFDSLYDPIFQSLRISLISAREIDKLCNFYTDVNNRDQIVTFRNSVVEFDKTKNIQIQKEFSSIIENSSIAIKNHLQALLKEVFDLNIGCLFQSEDNFNQGIATLAEYKLFVLARYLKSIRFWTHHLIEEIWNGSKHKKWKLDSVGLKLETNSGHKIILPEINNTPVNIFSNQLVNRCCLVVENLIVYGVLYNRSIPINVVEIPKMDRYVYLNKRFKVIPKIPGVNIWVSEFYDDYEIT
jgi:hypothetical protein